MKTVFLVVVYKPKGDQPKCKCGNVPRIFYEVDKRFVCHKCMVKRKAKA